MTRIHRVCILLYALAMMILITGLLFQERLASGSSYGELWFPWGATASAYAILAIGYLLKKNPGPGPSTPWLVAVVVCVVSQLVVIFTSDVVLEKHDLVSLLTFLPLPLIYLFVSGWLLAALNKTKRTRPTPARSGFLLAALIAGSGLVLASLALNTTDADSGWAVILGRSPWITSVYNVWSDVFWGPTIKWIQPFYALGGYAIYVLALASTIAMMAWLFACRLNSARVRRSRLLAGFTLVFTFCAFWIDTDIFWGWHFGLSNHPWAAVLATALWFAAPLFAIILLVPFFNRQSETWRLGMIVILQVPVAAFNYVMMPNILRAFIPDPLINLPGLAMLIIGLQLESWACIALLTLPTAAREAAAPPLPSQ